MGNKEEKIPAAVHIACGWPLLLVAVGGAVGGALGGAAYAVNFAVYKSKMPMPVKYILNIATGMAAVVLWVIFSLLIRKAMRH